MAEATTLDAALFRRTTSLGKLSGRWSWLAYASAMAFVALLYANPMYWFPPVERLRLAFLAMSICAAAVLAHRMTSGEQVRIGGAVGAALLAYLALYPASLLWTIRLPSTLEAAGEALKMGVVYVAVQNALDRPARVRTFLLVAALASLGPALGGVWVWWTGDHLIEGFRTHWRGLYGDPNRLAMSLVAVLPAGLHGLVSSRRFPQRLLFGGVVAAQLAAVVLTHSRSGAVAGAVAAALFLLRGGRKAAQAAVGALLLAGVVAFAPTSFWMRSATITEYETDASVEGRRHAWMVLGAIVDEHPLTGVGGGAFLASWDRYAPLEAGGRRYVAHNVLLETVGELGIPAFVLFSVFVALLLLRLWRAGADPVIGAQGRALFAALAGYLICEMANGYSLSWFLYFLFAASAATVHLAALRRAAEATA